MRKLYRYFLLLGLLTSPVLGEWQNEVVGPHYPIDEPHALNEIKERASEVGQLEANPMSLMQRLKSLLLPRNTQFLVRHEKMTFISPQDFVIPNVGIYPKGYEFNILNYVSMPGRIVVIGKSSDLDIVGGLQEDDLILVANGKDTREMVKKLGLPVFSMTEQMRQRFKFRGVPSIGQQVGSDWLITEFDGKDDA